MPGGQGVSKTGEYLEKSKDGTGKRQGLSSVNIIMVIEGRGTLFFYGCEMVVGTKDYTVKD